LATNLYRHRGRRYLEEPLAGAPGSPSYAVVAAGELRLGSARLRLALRSQCRSCV